jgi:hypothetical protein
VFVLGFSGCDLIKGFLGEEPGGEAVLQNAPSFSGPADGEESVIHMIRAASQSTEPLYIRLDSTTEEVSLTTETDLGTTGLVLTAGSNSPAVVTIDGGGRVITLTGAGKGSVITVDNGVMLALWNITFKGLDTNTAPLIKVNSGGRLVLQYGAVITGNNTTGVGGSGVYVGGGGVYVEGGALVMNGGAISGNTSSATGGMFNGGGGVAVYSGGSFTMNGGEISGNIAAVHGGGVCLSGSTFTMNGGKISGNTAASNGGGVAVYSNSTFTMNKGEISGNTANGDSGSYYGGGGVYANATFIMTGGVISGNNSAHYGGGVLLRGTQSFTKTSGVIYGYTAGSVLSNWVGTRKLDGTPDDHKADKGDVVYYYDGSTKHREKALGEGDTFDGDTGPWQ